MKTLVIVESPAKAGTIEKILGKDYSVTSSFGHIRDLAKGGTSNTGVDVEHGYKPTYIVPDDKKRVVKELHSLVKKHPQVLLATDEDREGEAISWHLFDELKLKKSHSKRITFTEITPEAIMAAIKSPRDIDIDLVHAQQARRILDKLVGFELTGLLWKKVKGQLSAGRVQSVAVRLIVDKEREIQSFKPKSFFKINGVFKKGTHSVEAELSKNIPSQKEAEDFLKKCIKADFTVAAVEVKPHKKSPSPPFTTSTLQQLAGQKLGFSVSRTMSTAQRLYEQGFISYMRTDSMNLSASALKNISGFINKEFGEKYSKPRQFTKKSKNAQEAHEAIRPTYIDKTHVSQDSDQQKLYELIRARTLASQMADALVEKTSINIDISTEKKLQFIAKGEVILFDGYLKAYGHTKWYAQDDVLLPPLAQGDALDYHDITALERYTKAPTRYSEATLVKKLEELGIGRPSTYAPTIAKITSPTRGYISKESREGIPTSFIQLVLKKGVISEVPFSESVGSQKNKLFASDIGMVVTDFLCEHFESIMDYAFTAEVEDKLDDIADGKAEWQKVLDYYYKPFNKTVEKTLDKAERASGEKILGKDEKTGRTILVRISKFGPVAQIGAPDELAEDEKPVYANLLPTQSLETVTLEEVNKLFEIPKTLGTYKDIEIIVNRGRFGPYLKYGDMSVSIKGIDPLTITLKESIEHIKARLEELKPIGFYKEKPITKGVGRFGPYLKWENTYVAITKKSGFELDTITEKQALPLLEEKIKKDAEKIMYTWESGNISIQIGRWGPFIKVRGKRKFYQLPMDKNGKKMDVEDVKKIAEKDIKKLLK